MHTLHAAAQGEERRPAGCENGPVWKEAEGPPVYLSLSQVRKVFILFRERR
jgi:hypothetical protein